MTLPGTHTTNLNVRISGDGENKYLAKLPHHMGRGLVGHAQCSPPTSSWVSSPMVIHHGHGQLYPNMSQDVCPQSISYVPQGSQ